MLDTIKRKIGVKTEKITITKEIRYCKPLILKGLQKNNEKTSTHPLTVLTRSVIFALEQEGMQNRTEFRD